MMWLLPNRGAVQLLFSFLPAGHLSISNMFIQKPVYLIDGYISFQRSELIDADIYSGGFLVDVGCGRCGLLS